MASTRRLTELCSRALERLRLPRGEVIVALSGGADSAALAYLLREVGVGSAAVHVDHGYPASDRLAAAARRVADTLGLSIRVVPVEVGEGASPEERARDARYEVLTNLGGTVVTAHTRDDDVETVLINLIRGTGTDGLAGIPRFRAPNIHRPMLGVTRDETREIATLAGLGYLDDPMNNDRALTRNKVRLQLLPLLREFNPAVDDAIARAAAAVRAESDLLGEITPDVDLGGGLAIGVVTTLSRPIADRLVRLWLTAHDVEVSADALARVWSVASGVSPRQDLNGGRSVVRREALLSIE